MNICRAATAGVTMMVLFCVSNALASSGLAEYDQPWEICALCHSLDGNPRMAKFPKLAGQPTAYIEKQLQDFLSGARNNDGGQMSAIVTEVSENDFAAIAGWFSAQAHPEPALVGNVDLSAGEGVYVNAGCQECHSLNGQQNADAIVPILASQHAQFLKKQLLDFKENNRVHREASPSIDPVLELTESEIDALVGYLAATHRQ